MKSWKTTMGGIVAALMIALPEVCDALGVTVEGHTDGIVAWNSFVAASGIIYALWNARDNDKSSEDAGIK